MCGHLGKGIYTSVMCEAEGGSWGATEHWVFEAKLQLVSKGNAHFRSVGDSPIEVEVPHVFGRFLRSAHLLVVEDDPPAPQREHFLKKHTLTEA